MRPVLIVNPNSAGGQTRRRWPQLEAEIRDVLGELEVRFTERTGHATELARAALAEGAEQLIAMGGDGTVNEVVNGFFDEAGRPAPGSERAAFGILPAGTGGDFVKTAGVPRLLADAARRIAEGTSRKIDVARLTYLGHGGGEEVRHFVNIASFGIGGLVDRYADGSPGIKSALGGKASFLIASFRASLAYHNARCRITLDGGQPSEKRIYSCAVANGRYFGGGMMIAPQAELDDGRFDVVTIGDVSMATMLLHSPKIYRGAHVDLPFVTVERATEVRAESLDSEEVLLDVDGEQPGRLPARFELRPRAIGLLA
jgi:YegS/Rv2252/BmrU family lipid kinase